MALPCCPAPMVTSGGPCLSEGQEGSEEGSLQLPLFCPAPGAGFSLSVPRSRGQRHHGPPYACRPPDLLLL